MEHESLEELNNCSLRVTDRWRNESPNIKWLRMNEDTAYRKILICNASNSGNYLDKAENTGLSQVTVMQIEITTAVLVG
jgi:hypothetical protein